MLLGPFFEELVFRRLLMSYFNTVEPAVLSVLLSSLTFGLAHVFPSVILYATLFGLGCALVTRRHKSLWAGLILHLVNNLFLLLVALMALQ
ncbi:CPBP family intramembrane glutamic endopeptidase [Corynebacterium aquatimens]|nr:CPBP family intramembrane glutamic endopeptidase [Corynebacterium aquatimens]WJY66391.1 CAAX amino terminal protease self- immunity [Corynebacterium aquatimens]